MKNHLKIVIECDDLPNMRSHARFSFFAPEGGLSMPSAAAIAALAFSTSCNPFRSAYSEQITEGKQFAHQLRFPSRFREPTLPKEPPPYPGAPAPTFYFDHLGFRTVATSPDVLLVAGCGYFGDIAKRELCSPNSFSIDTARGYAVRGARIDEWERAIPIPGAGGLRNPVALDKPYPGRITRNGLVSGETSGWAYRGKSYLYPRSDDFRGSAFMTSADGGLVLLIGVNKRKLPKTGFIVGDAEGGGLYGNYTIDVFRSSPEQRIAALEMDCNRASTDCMENISVANSRWFAVPLATDLSKALLFDFGKGEVK